jgi:ribonuclease HI
MPWVEATLRDQRVLARCDGDGKLQADGGRVDVVYRAGAAKVYRAGAANITIAKTAAQYTDEQVANGGLHYLSDAPPKEAKATPSKAKVTAAAYHAHHGEPSGGKWIAYTDGACSGNPGPAGAGVVLLGPNKEIVEGYEYLGSQTNNVGELVGIERALELFPQDASDVTIYTDSQYAIGVLSKGWKAKANVALIGRIREKIKARKKVHLVYVRGHAGVEYNEKADELARLAVSSRKTAMPSRNDVRK